MKILTIKFFDIEKIFEVVIGKKESCSSKTLSMIVITLNTMLVKVVAEWMLNKQSSMNESRKMPGIHFLKAIGTQNQKNI